MNIKKLPEEIQNVILTAYKIGTWDGNINAKEPKDVLLYIQHYINNTGKT